jgi:hypothetical protein
MKEKKINQYEMSFSIIVQFSVQYRELQQDPKFGRCYSVGGLILT